MVGEGPQRDVREEERVWQQPTAQGTPGEGNTRVVSGQNLTCAVLDTPKLGSVGVAAEQVLGCDPGGGRVDPAVWNKLQALLGRQFTHEACGDCGASVMQRSSHLYSQAKQFLHDCTRLENATVLLHTTPDTAAAMLQHYSRLKAEAPHTVAACALIPAGKGVRWRQLMRGWQWVDTVQVQAEQRAWHMRVYIDPVQPKLRAAVSIQDELLMQFASQVAGLSAQALVDSGASEVFVSRALVLRAGLKEIPLPKPAAVELGDRSSATVDSTAVLPFRLGAYKAKLQAYVMSQIPEGFDLVLGDNWLRSNKVVLDYGRRALCVRQGRKVLVVKAKAGAGPHVTPVSASQAQQAHTQPEASAKTRHQVLSAMQFKKELRRAQQKGEPAFIAMVRAVGETRSDSPSTDPAAPQARPEGAALMSEATVEAIKAEFADILVEELPPGLPPDRGLGYDIIPTIPGAKPPNRPLYRMSPRELEEVKRQVAELLEKGLIQESSSPYGSPVLFVPKKDGSLRMCVDYRALNKITVRNSFPLPLIEELLDSLHGCKVFSSLDLCSGYWQIRLSPEDSVKTAFKTPQGLFEFKVLAFGLCNAPSAFAATMSRVFSGLVGRKGSGVHIYLDDVLVYARNAEEHEAVLREVLSRLRQHKLYAKASKCKFNLPEVGFLGHVVGQDGTKPDPKKVQTVLDTPRPRSVQELRSFLGLANYFRKFLQNFASRVIPLQELTKGKNPTWDDAKWGARQEEAFQWIKTALTSVPALASPDVTRPFVVTTDASTVGIGAVLEQDGHPVAFESKKLTDAESRYTTTEQEMLAVVHALRTWRCFLEGGSKFVVRTDHNPNTYFHTKPQLSRREARWSEFLSQFHFEWQYVKGTTNAVADHMSRYPTGAAVAEDSGPQNLGFGALWCSPPKGLKPGETVFRVMVIKARRPMIMAAMARRKTAQRVTPLSTAETPEQAAVLEEYRHAGVMPLLAAMRKAGKASSKRGAGSTKAAAPKAGVAAGPVPGHSASLLERIKLGYAEDPFYCGKSAEAKAIRAKEGLELHNGVWWKVDGNSRRVAVPGYQAYTEAILFEAHDAPSAGHAGVAKTLARVKQHWWWPTLARDVEAYVRECDMCQRNKGGKRNRGLLHPLHIPARPWESISMDFVTGLPESPEGYDALWVVVDRLTKMVHLVPCTFKGLDAPLLARMFVHHVWRLHGLPREIVSDRDTRFTSEFWREVCKLVGTKQLMSTAFHPQTDGQTEVMNKTVQDMLRHYVAGDLASWVQHLDLVEYAINSAVQESTRETPFYLNYGQQPHSPVALMVELAKPEMAKSEAKAWVQQLHEALQRAKRCMKAAQDRQKAYADKRRTDAWQPAVGEEVMLHSGNIELEGPKKLMPRWLGPFKVLKQIGPAAFRLELSAGMGRIHDVFHVSMLKPYTRAVRTDGSGPAPLLKDRAGDVWEVERILAHRCKTSSSKTKGRRADGSLKARATKQRRNHFEYKVRWKGFSAEHDSWEPESHIVGGAAELLAAYWAAGGVEGAAVDGDSPAKSAVKAPGQGAAKRKPVAQPKGRARARAKV